VLRSSPSPRTPPPPDLAERRFRALQQAIPEIAWSAAASGDLLHDAPAWRELTGQTQEQLLAPLGWLEAVHPEDRQRTLQTFLVAASESKAWSVEYRLRLADGTFRWMRARGAPVLDDSGRVLEMIVVHATIAESADAERERLLLREVVRQIPAGLIVRGKDGSVLFANDRLRQLVGDLERTHEVTRLDGATLHPSEWPLRRALQHGETVVGEKVRYRSPVQGEVTVVLSAAPVRDSSGEIFAAVGTLQQESHSELLVRTLAESIPALVWRTGAEGRSEFLNGMARRFFGPEGGIARDAWVERLHPDDRERAMRERARGVHRQQLFDLQYRMRDDSGEYRVFYTRTAPVRENGKITGWVGTALDVTDRTRAEGEIRRVAAFTEELLGIVGHDLRDPLNIVMLATTLLRMTDLRDDQRKPVARIAAAAERAVRMLETLLDFTQARIGGGIKVRRAPTDLAQLCADLAAEQERIQVAVSAAGDCTGSWDRARLEQLIGNLLRNAADHGTPGQEVELRCTAEADRVVLSVRNSGAPIAPGMLPTLFEPFKRGARGQGSRNLGLGLYIVRQIAVAHGGSVEARSSAEEGTEFRVILPR